MGFGTEQLHVMIEKRCHSVEQNVYFHWLYLHVILVNNSVEIDMNRITKRKSWPTVFDHNPVGGLEDETLPSPRSNSLYMTYLY